MDYIQDISTFIPGTIIAAGSLIALLTDALSAKAKNTYWIAIITLVLGFMASITDLFGGSGISFNGLVAYGGVAAFGQMIVIFGTLFCVLLSHEYLDGIEHEYGEVYSLILFATVGMIALAASNDLIMIFLGIETMSICLYVLAGIIKDEKRGAESALKYFLLGAFSTGFLLYGMALLYGASGSTNLQAIAEASDQGALFWVGVGLLLVGFFFKISAVPFHMWTPDVYQGTPTTLTAFMATASKTATYIAFIFVLSRMLATADGDWHGVLKVIAIITMIGGNLVALVQDNVKRMLAYSSIAHAGYLMVGLAAATPEGYSAVLYYLMVYTFMNIGAFGVLAYYERQHGLDFTEIENLAGLGFKQPAMAIMLSIFLFSLAGIPPFAGFIGKYQVFAAAVNVNLIGLALVGVLASAASVYYYLRVMVYLFMKEPQTESTLTNPGFIFKGAIVVLTAFTIYFGIMPGGISELISSFYEINGVVSSSAGF